MALLHVLHKIVMNQISFTAIGDAGIDVYPNLGKSFPGGTAFNVAVHAKRAGASSSIITALGTDDDGAKSLRALEENVVNTTFVERLPGETSRVEANLDEHGKPIFDNWRVGVMKDFHLKEKHTEFLATQSVATAILYEPIRHIFEEFASMELPNTMKVGDFSTLASLYTTGLESLEKLAPYFNIVAVSIDEDEDKQLHLLSTLSKEHHIMTLALQGINGSTIFYHNKTFHIESKQIKVVDTAGAGDTYLAHFLVTYVETHNIPLAMEKATEEAGKTIGHLGTT